MEPIVFYLLMVQELLDLKQNILKLILKSWNWTPLCLGNISKDFSKDNMKKTGLYGCVYDLSVNYDDAIAVNDILDIHKYLTKKHGIV